MQEPAQPTQQSPHQSATSNPNQQQELVMPPIDLASRYGPNSSAIKLVTEIEFIHFGRFQDFHSFRKTDFIIYFLGFFGKVWTL